MFYMQILLSIALGFVIGLEREFAGKSAGIRTIMLISLGATILTIVSLQMADVNNTRLMAQIVVGIGFIGAGCIMQSKGEVKGLTTATSIWLASAVGILVGCNYYVEAVVITLLIVFILYLVGLIRNKLFKGE